MTIATIEPTITEHEPATRSTALTIRSVLCAFGATATLAITPITATVAESDLTTAAARTTVVNRTELIKWLADGEHGLWIQARSVSWLSARFAGVCHRVSLTNSVSPVTDGS